MQRPTTGDFAAFSIGGAIGVLLASMLRGRERPALSTVAHVDITRFLGRWYEIARYPNRFERLCERDVHADYSVRPDGRISVVNSCMTPRGRILKSRATAKIAEPSSNAKLKVSFGWPFSGDYWIIDLGPNYEYAVVGEPSRRFLWVLSRTPALAPPVYQKILAKLPLKGYVPSRLVMTRQSAIQTPSEPLYGPGAHRRSRARVPAQER